MEADTTGDASLDVPADGVEQDNAAPKEKGKGRAGRGGSRGGRLDRQVLVSKALSKLLRHRAAEAGIPLDAEGFAPLDKVLAYGPIKSLKTTLEDVQSVVSTNDKQRFLLKANPSAAAGDAAGDAAAGYLIRANQGHSIRLESSSLLEPLTAEAGNVPARVLHGTYFSAWGAIEAAGGLRPMGRNHVHCSEGLPGEEGVVSGMRGDAELVVEIDVRRSMEEGGLRWWRSDNGVVLTEGDEGGLVSARFFRRVTGRRVDVGVLWEDGERTGSKQAMCIS
ncbi:tRNA 2'-phosphotransferase 1 [Escovopsis weberi]|uniref:2'-phosphotransferase n=1 Tax=Escovopsis weberi TaxID=150374 RepID=A0A0M9VRY4_ESCWE|nr:tRNA 2'-phosphotransferase 1 [Escovopsis weberi]